MAALLQHCPAPTLITAVVVLFTTLLVQLVRFVLVLSGLMGDPQTLSEWRGALHTLLWRSAQ